MVAASYPFLDVLWSMVIFFAFVIWIWLLITVFADVFRRRDIGGGMKAIWIIFVIVLPPPASSDPLTAPTLDSLVDIET